MRNKKMIRKTNKQLLNWIYEYIIDFTDEKDTSGLTWSSTHDEALKFLHSIPQKERVQRYGFYSTHSTFFLVDSFDEIKEVLKNGFISQRTCRIIYNWNLDVGRENWNMVDVNTLLIQNTMSDNGSKQKYLSNPLNKLKELGLIECINPEAKRGKLYRLTEKGEEIFGEI